MNSQQLGLPAQGLHKTDPVNVQSLMTEGLKSPGLSLEICWQLTASWGKRLLPADVTTAELPILQEIAPSPAHEGSPG